MKKEEKQAVIAIPVTIIIAALIAYAGSQGGIIVCGFPLFSLCFALSFLIQWIAFIPAFIKKTESFFDLTGSITYLTVVVVAVVLSSSIDARTILLLTIVAVWAIRLGSFLYMRIRAEGFDRRFTHIKPSCLRFLLAWTLQGLWVSLSLAAALASITSTIRVEFDLFALAGLLVWIFGFGIEWVADRQKGQFRANPENSGKYIDSGLWSWSRHPNYFGEIVLWIGVAIIALPVLRSWQWVTMISPLFIILLLTRVSGIPMLEAKSDEKWGGKPDYEAYKARTPELILKPPSNSRQVTR